MNSEKSEKKYMYDNQAEVAANLLKEKYNEEFEVAEIGKRYGTLNNDTFTAACYPKSNKKILFTAEVSKEGDFFEDNYLSRVACEEITDELTAAFNSSSVAASVLIVSRPDLIDGTNAAVGANEIIASVEDIDFVVYVVKDSAATDDKALDTVKSLKATYGKFAGECRIYTTDSKDDVTRFAELVSEDKTFTSDMGTLLSGCEENDYNF